MRMLLLFLAILPFGCGSDSVVGAWKTLDGKFSLEFTDQAQYFQWDTAYPPASLVAIDPAQNPRGAKILGTYTVEGEQLTVTGRDGLYPAAQAAAVNLSSAFSVDGNTLTAPGLVSNVSTYLRTTSAP